MAAPTGKRASKAFETAVLVPSRLLDIEADGDWGRGNPARQQALRGAAVVLTVAAWQGFIEDIARAVLYGTTKKAGTKANQLAALASTSLDQAMERFHTPNMTNVTTLFGGVGFDLGTMWTASDGNSTLTSAHASDLVNAWLHVRHSVAHGIPFHENEKLVKLRKATHVKSRVATGKGAGGGAGLILAAGDANGCRDLFVSMHKTVASSAANYLASL